MKCIHCGTDSKLKERSDGKCKACRHRFAFEPTKDKNRVTDGAFKAAIQGVSGRGDHFFTERQLYYELNRRLLRKQFWVRPWSRVAGISLAGGIGMTFLSAGLLALPGIVLGAGGVTLGAIMSSRKRKRMQKQVVFDFAVFKSTYLEPWNKIHGAPEKMVPSEVPQPARSLMLPPDVTQYSFDRALVVEDAQTAAMLVANRFHFENNCAILSRDGYPFGSTRVGESGQDVNLRQTVIEMLRRNPRLRIFTAHSASVEGCLLARVVREPEWFPDPEMQVMDLGLRPSHVRGRDAIVLHTPKVRVPEELRSFLQPEETAWLEAGTCVELASIRPARLMRSIFQGFARANRIDASGGPVTDWDPGGGYILWGHDRSADVYAADSFG